MSKPLRLAINGYGRIGRIIHRIALSRPQEFVVVAANSLSDAATNAHLLKYDSLFGRLSHEVVASTDSFSIDGQVVRNYNGNPGKDFRWDELGVDIVIESTGIFRTVEKCQQHLDAGAKKVILTAPADDAMPTFVMGVNSADYAGETIVSNASCTTNCTAPLAKVLHEVFGIKSALLTTTHAVTSDQMIHDGVHKDLHRARNYSQSIIPTKTGVASAIKAVLPAIGDRFDGLSLRVPVQVVSAIDLTVQLEKSATKEEINAALKSAAAGELKNILAVSAEPLVSIDLKGDSHSSIVAAEQTKVVGDLVKVIAWYDNEWGYSTRVLDLARHISA